MHEVNQPRLLPGCRMKQAQMKQEIEGTGNSLGVWCMKLINPDCFLGAEFIYLLQEMVQVNNNLKLLKKTNFLYHF